MCGWLSVCVSPTTGWQCVQGVTRLSPLNSLDRLQIHLFSCDLSVYSSCISNLNIVSTDWLLAPANDIRLNGSDLLISADVGDVFAKIVSHEER